MASNTCYLNTDCILAVGITKKRNKGRTKKRLIAGGMLKQPCVHLCAQAPFNLSGGMGIAVLSLARAQMAHGHKVSWLTLQLRGESEKDVLEYPEGALTVERVPVPDSDIISNHNGGSETYRFARREYFCQKALQHIKRQYSPDSCIYLHGLFFEPLMAASLPEFTTIGVYHLLWTKRLEALGEQRSLLFPTVQQLEILSLIASKYIQAISAGMLCDMIELLSLMEDPAINAELKRIAPHYAVSLPQDTTQAIESLKQKTCIVPHGVDSDFSKPILHQTAPKLVGAWGRMTPEKGFEFLIEVARHRQNLSFSLWGILGDAEPKRLSYKEHILSLGKDLPNLSLDFRADGLRGDELLRKIDACEIIVIPSIYEPFGLVLLEAMARGKPVIVSATAGPTHTLGAKLPGKYSWGYLIGNNARGMNQAIDAALKDFFTLSAQEKQAMGISAAKLASKYSWQTAAARINAWISKN